MNKCCALVVYFFEIDDEFGGVMLRVCDDLRAKQRDDVIRDDAKFLVLEVGVVDAEIRVKPVDLVGNEFPRDKSLQAMSDTR